MELLPQEYLTNIIKTTRDHHPNFVLLTGAGTSVTSGVATAKILIDRWRQKHYEIFGSEKVEIEQYLNKQNWYKKQDEYSILFEELYDQPSQRREFIESCIKGSSPSWGYIYLVNLLKKNVFNTIFTTNFDDLLNEACYMFSDNVRPIICSHDSSIRSIRITSKRHKIIKLHGDFLFDNIKNTVTELQSLDQNTLEKFKQYASEFGLIVVGYSGNDKSIMDSLNILLRHEEYFPNGIYWCLRNESELSNEVNNLLRYSKVKLIKIDGFDEMFAEVHECLDLDLQLEMSNPYEALARRLNNLMDNIKIPPEQLTHKIIERDIKNLAERISQFSNFEKGDLKNTISLSEDDQSIFKINIPLPYGLLSQKYFREKDYQLSFEFAKEELKIHPEIKTYSRIFESLLRLNRNDELNEYLESFFKSEQLIAENINDLNDIAIKFIEFKEYDIADKILNFGNDLAKKFQIDFNYEYQYLNKLQIKKHKNIPLTEDEIIILKKMLDNKSEIVKYGVNILLENYKEAEKLLVKLIEQKIGKEIVNWPITKLLYS